MRDYKTRIIAFIIGIFFTSILYANAYLDRFNAYTYWSEHLPEGNDESFLSFVDGDTPLAQKLRERWLYKLGQQKNWRLYQTHYKPSADINLQCFKSIADFHLGDTATALTEAQRIWLSGDSLPPVCEPLFSFFSDPKLAKGLLNQRIHLALEKRNLSLARYLLKQDTPARLSDELSLMKISAQPKEIIHLSSGPLQGVFYLYGLKRLVSINMELALTYWQLAQSKKILSLAEQQQFIIHMALYKAMRDQPDAAQWFAKVKPAYYTSALSDWQIRLALKQHQWPLVIKLINDSPDRALPCWQYWLARALAETGHPEQARAIYKELAKKRHYYGFLASMRLHQPFSFQNEALGSHKDILKTYEPFTLSVKKLIINNQEKQASRLLTDFIAELPKQEKAALVTWIAQDLQWYGKALYLSNDEQLSNYLTLRFPLHYKNFITTYGDYHQIPPALIYAVIRQESGFREDVVSPAGARGLMQVLPSTAKAIASQKHIKLKHKDELFSSDKNIRLGTAYLSHLAQHFNHHFILIAAAYNAGPHQVNYWIKNHIPEQMDVWIDTLPWFETRNYLKNIVSFYVVYQYRLGLKPDLGKFLKPLS